ncbi:Replication protein A 70 kDa DNA-binding subunit C [Porphyridium purpureum]|uniref:Replication protein A subunit n=1 Tax=Porphyridium purpureum TaxID=35688 RepID=A0A5J4Z812_PORPP|nr:Replication protein A 70 kDa DNA-binding subunit C [Porphyridium purpureum]|eukprot:POR8031..scf295_1
MELTRGAISRIGLERKQEPRPCLQVVQVKLIQHNNGAGAGGPDSSPVQRFRLVLSDGEFAQPAMAGTQLNPLFLNNQVQVGCLVVITEYAINSVANKVVIIVLNLEVVSEPLPQIGTPRPLFPVGNKAAAPQGQPALPQAQHQPVGAPAQINGQQQQAVGMKMGAGPGNGFQNYGTPVHGGMPVQQQQYPQQRQQESYAPPSNVQTPGAYRAPYQPAAQNVANSAFGNAPLQQQHQQQPQVYGGGFAHAPVQSSMHSSVAAGDQNLSINPSFQNQNLSGSTISGSGHTGTNRSTSFGQPYQAKPHSTEPTWSSIGSGAVARMTAPPLPGTGAGSMGADDAAFTPIATLSPYVTNYCIKGRVTLRNNLRRYQNEKREGVLFSFELQDNTASIKIACFNEVAERLADQVQMNKLYSVKRAQVKAADRRYNRTTSQFEITLDNRSEVIPLPDDGTVKGMQFEFTKLAMLESIAPKTFVDVIGVVKDCSEVVQLTSKTSGEMMTKRTLTLVDDSGVSAPLTLWNDAASKYDAENTINAIILCKGIRRGDFQGVSLDGMRSSFFELHPDVEQAHQLRAWYDSAGRAVPFRAIGGPEAGHAGGMTMEGDKLLTLEEMQSIFDQERVASDPRGQYYTVLARVMFVRRKTFCYAAAPDTGRKVVQQAPGRWISEADGKEYENCEYRYILQLNVADDTSMQQMNAFNDVGTHIIGLPAQELAPLPEEDPFLFEKFGAASQRLYRFRVRAKVDDFNGTSRIKHTILRADSVDFTKEAVRMMSDVRKYHGC